MSAQDWNDEPRFQRIRKRARNWQNHKPPRNALFCRKKRIYPSREIAQQVCDKQLRLGVPFLRVYQCPVNDKHWHLTHKQRK